MVVQILTKILSNWDVSIFGTGTDEGNGLLANCTSFNNGGTPGISGWNTTNWDEFCWYQFYVSKCSEFQSTDW